MAADVDGGEGVVAEEDEGDALVEEQRYNQAPEQALVLVEESQVAKIGETGGEIIERNECFDGVIGQNEKRAGKAVAASACFWRVGGCVSRDVRKNDANAHDKKASAQGGCGRVTSGCSGRLHLAIQLFQELR